MTAPASSPAAALDAFLSLTPLVSGEDQATYQESPKIKSLSAFTIGGTARMRHAQVIRGEDIGREDPGSKRPILPIGGSSIPSTRRPGSGIGGPAPQGA